MSIECDFIDQQTEVTRNDKKPRKQSSEISLGDVMVGEFIRSMEDVTHKFNALRYSLRLDKLVIEGNTFDGNEIGMKGSAIFARQVTNLLITGNTISRSQPAYSFRPQAKDYPYYKYLALKSRPTLFVQPSFYAFVKDELDFAGIDKFEAKLSIKPASPEHFGAENEADRLIINLPQVQGAIYIETCPEFCLVNYVAP